MSQNKNLISWSILVSLMLVWGSSFILIKKSLDYFSATEVGILRITITFIFLLPLAIIRLKRTSKKQRFFLFIAGFVGSFLPAFLFAIAQTGISSSLAGILNSLTPLFTLLLGIYFFRIKATLLNSIGVILGLAGAIGLIYVSSGEQGFVFNFKYASFVIFAAFCYAFTVNFIKVYLKEVDALTITALTFFYIGIPTLLYMIFFSDIMHKLFSDQTSLPGFGYVSILAIAGTGIALIAFNKLIKTSTPVFASSVTYIIPVVAIAWGIIDGEVFKTIYLFWFAIIIIGVLMVNTTSRNNIKSVLTRMFSRKQKN